MRQKASAVPDSNAAAAERDATDFIVPTDMFVNVFDSRIVAQIEERFS
jgi:hypothetical protein